MYAHQVPFQIVTHSEGKAAFRRCHVSPTLDFVVGTTVSTEGYKSLPEIFDNTGNQANNWSTFQVQLIELK